MLNKMIFIKVKNQFDWEHRWKDAPESERFLRYPHRHLFYVETKIEVSENDRELEYFAIRKIIKRLVKKFIKEAEGLESCEMIGEYLLDYLETKFPKNRIEVSVLEDNENGSIVNNYERFNSNE